MARRRGPRPATANDLLAETFAQAWRARRSFRSQSSRVRENAAAGSIELSRAQVQEVEAALAGVASA